MYLIYQFLFINLKSYIGQTVNFADRLHNHKQKAREDKIKNVLYNAIRKYGWETIVINKLVFCSPEDADDLERLYIQKFKTLDKKFGYNLDSGGVLNKNHSESTRQKISKANQNKSKQLFKKKSKKVEAYTLDGVFVGIYESASAGARLYGVANNTIARAANGGRKSSCGLLWRWHNK